MPKRKAKSLEDISSVLVRSMTLDKLSILFTLNQFGTKERRYFYRKGLHNQVIWLKNYRLIKPIRLETKNGYRLTLTEKGKRVVALYRQSFGSKHKRALKAIGMKPLTETNF